MSRARRTLAQPWLYLDDAEYDLTEWTKKADKVYADGQEDDLVALLGELRSMLSKVQDDLGRARQDASEAAKEHLPDGTVDHYLPHAVAFNQKLVERISHHLGNFPTEINDMVSVLGEDEIVAHDEEGLELEHIIPRLEKYFPQREGVEEVTQELERITRGTDPRNIPEPDDDVERSKWEVLRVQSDKLHALYKAIRYVLEELIYICSWQPAES
ncbi:hypothetical protein PMZ80_003596 [Knufia obscura]|uniref:Uncharacterized protein n=2 Tax=Knufia TaxID=430999 RepID=A0AAN8EME2_9EURO|nr:hypothetical protein PMZ80_003596 [Knufia obscura]KAK5958488.1 hypothetical protein OHC33_000331 [Knufia fluminis]